MKFGRILGLLAACSASVSAGQPVPESLEAPANMLENPALWDREDLYLGSSKFSACWKNTKTRGVGRPVHECPNTANEEQALLCYKPCKSGYAGVGPVCWEKCKSGYEDLGLFCKNGKTVKTKKSYGRGVGKPLQCKASEDQDDIFFGLCYPKCSNGFNGVGPVCWEECGGEFGYDGGALCCKSKEDCKVEVMDMAVKFPIAIAKAVWDSKDIVKEMADIKDIIHDALGFVLPLCSQLA